MKTVLFGIGVVHKRTTKSSCFLHQFISPFLTHYGRNNGDAQFFVNTCLA